MYAIKRFIPDERKMEELRQLWHIEGMKEKDIIWNGNCDLLEEYSRQFGSCNIPRSVTCNTFEGETINIGRWLDNQRTAKTAKKLLPEREVRLQRLVDQGLMAWVLDRSLICTDDGKWDTMFEVLIQYGEDHGGNCNVPFRFTWTLPDNTKVKLGLWLYHQRQYKKGIGGKLRPDREKKLQDLVDVGSLKWNMRE